MRTKQLLVCLIGIVLLVIFFIYMTKTKQTDRKTVQINKAKVVLDECPENIVLSISNDGVVVEHKIKICFLWNHGLARAAYVHDFMNKSIQESYVYDGIKMVSARYSIMDIFSDEDAFKRRVAKHIAKEIQQSNDRAYLQVEKISRHEIRYPKAFLEEILDEPDLSPDMEKKINEILSEKRIILKESK